MKKHERSARLALFEETPERDEVVEVRKTLLYRVLLVVWVAGLPAICLGAIHAYVQGRWVFTVIYGGIYLSFLLITLPLIKTPYYVKAFALVVSLFFVSLAILVRLGMSGVGLELMIGVCFMASLFFGFRKGIVALFACSAGIALVAAGMIAGLIPIRPEHMLNSGHPVTWMIALCGFIMIVSLAIIAPEILKRRVEESLDLEERHKKELEIANQRLREEIQGHEAAETALRESEFRFRTFYNSNPEGVALLDLGGTILDVNKSLLAMSGYTVLDFIDRPFTAFVPAAFHTETEKAVGMIQKGISLDAPMEVFIMRKDGKPLPVSIKGWRISDEESRPVALGVFVHDLTRERDLAEEKAALEKQLVQSQRIEAIGTLAGGIAHDFNNILGGIIGYTELALMEEFTDAEEKKRIYLTRVLDAGKRAKDLVQQILRFSRPHEVTVSTIAITPLIEEAVKLLKSTLPKTIQIEQNIDAEMDVVSGDPTQFHQVIMNLCTNAYHAMRERGGVLTLSL